VNENRVSLWRRAWFARLVVISVLLLFASVPPYLDAEVSDPGAVSVSDHPWLAVARATHLFW